MATEREHDDYLNLLADSHLERLLESLSTLENRLADYLLGAPDRDGKLFDVEWAVSARSELRQIIESEYSQTVQSLLDDYPEVSVRALEMLNNYGDFAQTSPAVIQQLQRLTFQGFEDIASTFLDDIANEVYQNALTGRSKAEMIKSIRQSINGVYMQSDQAEINRLVDIAKNGTAAQSKAAIEKLHSVYAADRTGNNMRRYASQIAQDSLMQFDAAINVNAGIQAGAEKWKYYGDVIRDSRPFCREHAGNVYTTEEIEEIWQGSWAGKSSSDAFTARGGYNCRHHWRPIFEDDADANTPAPRPRQEPEPKPEAGLPKVESKAKTAKAINSQLDAAGKTTSTDRSAAAYVVGADGVLPSRFRVNGRKRGELTQKAMERSIGKISAGSLTPESVAILNQLLKETAELGKKFKAPPIRGVNTVSGRRAAGNMGDGLLGLNQKYFNKYSKRAYITQEKLEAEILAANAKLDELRKEYADKLASFEAAREARDAARSKYATTREYINSPEYLLVKELADEVDKARKKANRQIDLLSDLSAVANPRKISKWTVADDLAERPHTAAGFFESDVDVLRNLTYHEYAHLVHQETWRNLTDMGESATSFEKFLDTLFYKGRRRDTDRVFPTVYSETDPQEWFAESFALYNMGREDLIDPILKEFLDAIAESDGAIKFFNNWDFEKGGPIS